MKVLSSFGAAVWLVSSLICPADARAGTMLSPVVVLGTDLGTYDVNLVPLENMINQSSIDKPFTSGVTDFDEYFNTGDPAYGQGGPGNWQSDYSFNLPLAGYVDFDLGDTYPVDRIAIWNRSLEDIDVYFADSPGGLDTLGGSFTLQNRLNYPFSYLPEILEFDSTVAGRYMRLVVNSTYLFSPSDTFAYAIVGEVVVDTVPSTSGYTADFDGDGDVDGDDLDDWQAAYAMTDLADADLDGDSDGADFLAWQQQYGSGPVLAAVAAVPEPSTCWLALLSLAAVVFARQS